MKRSRGRNFDMKRLFRPLCILEKQKFLPQSTLRLYWRFERLDDIAVREVVLKFADLKLVKRERVDRCVEAEEELCVRLHDLVLELSKKMEVDEQKACHFGLINAYRSIVENGRSWKQVQERAGRWKTMDKFWKFIEAFHCERLLVRT